MSIISTTVEVKYRVGLTFDESNEKVINMLVRHCGDTINADEADLDRADIVEWLQNNIKEEDYYDWEATIEDLYVNGNPY